MQNRELCRDDGAFEDLRRIHAGDLRVHWAYETVRNRRFPGYSSQQTFSGFPAGKLPYRTVASTDLGYNKYILLCMNCFF